MRDVQRGIFATPQAVVINVVDVIITPHIDIVVITPSRVLGVGRMVRGRWGWGRGRWGWRAMAVVAN